MQIQLLDVETINGMQPDDPAWVVFDEEKDTAIGHQQDNIGKFLVIAFLKEEDARHFARILKQTQPERFFAYKVLQIRPLFDAITESGDNVGLLSPNDARKFFQENYPDLFPEYYE